MEINQLYTVEIAGAYFHHSIFVMIKLPLIKQSLGEIISTRLPESETYAQDAVNPGSSLYVTDHTN